MSGLGIAHRSSLLRHVDRDDAVLLIFAVRYALGRKTFAPTIIKSALVRHQEWLTDKDARQLVSEIEAQREYGYGDRCDEEKWEDTLDWLREMLDRGLFRSSASV